MHIVDMPSPSVSAAQFHITELAGKLYPLMSHLMNSEIGGGVCNIVTSCAGKFLLLVHTLNVFPQI